MCWSLPASFSKYHHLRVVKYPEDSASLALVRLASKGMEFHEVTIGPHASIDAKLSQSIQ